MRIPERRCDFPLQVRKTCADYRQSMTPPRPVSAESILIADDDEMFAHVLAAFLEKEGYHCECVRDAASVIAALQRRAFPLLISDIGMPGNDNLELVQTLAAMPTRPRIILLTGNPSVPTATKAVGLPATAYLTKPPDRAELLRIIAEALSDGRALRTLTASQQRVQDWADDLGRVQQLLERAPASDSGRFSRRI
jgi:DNA-binding NtrC family response regulator